MTVACCELCQGVAKSLEMALSRFLDGGIDH